MSNIPPEGTGDIPSEGKSQSNLQRDGISDVEWIEFEDWYYHGADLRLDRPEDLTAEELQREIFKFREEKQHSGTPQVGVSENIASQREETGSKARDVTDKAAQQSKEQSSLMPSPGVGTSGTTSPVSPISSEDATSIPATGSEVTEKGAKPLGWFKGMAKSMKEGAEKIASGTQEKLSQFLAWTRKPFGKKAKLAGAASDKGGKFSRSVAWYRTKRARWKKTGRTIDRGVRGTVTGGILGGSTWYVAGRQLVQNALEVGNAVASGVANGFCIAAPVAPLAYPLVRLGVAKWRHGNQKEIFEACEKNNLGMNDVDQVCENEVAFQHELDQPTVELIDQPGEQELIKAFHIVMRDLLANIPHFVTEERYAQHCFTKMVETCKNAAAKAENARTAEEKIMANYHPFDAAGGRLPDAAERILHMRQIAIAYGKMLAERERQEGESQITGAIAGASVGLLFTYGPLAPIVGGAAWAGRKLWRRHKETQVHIEVNERNELVGKEGQPIYNPTTYRSDVASLYRNGDFVTQAEDEAKRKEWREEEGVKLWLKSIVIPAESVQRCRTGAIRTPRDLALETAPRVQEQLKNLRIEYRSPVNTSKVRGIEMQIEAETEDLKNLRAQRSPSKDALDQCAARLKELRQALSEEKNPKPRSGPDGAILPLTIEEIGKNIDAGKAFAVGVVETFLANAKQGWVRKKTGEALAPVGSAAKEAAVEVVVKPVIIGGLSVGGIFLAGKLIGMLGGITVSTPVTLTVGGAVGIYALVRSAAAAIKDFKWGKGSHAEKKEPDKK